MKLQTDHQSVNREKVIFVSYLSVLRILYVNFGTINLFLTRNVQESYNKVSICFFL